MGILEILAEQEVIQKDDIEAIKKAAEKDGTTIEQVLLKRGVSPKDILKSKGEYFNIPTRKLETDSIPSKVFEYIPQETASQYKVVPIALTDDNVLEVGIVDPDNLDARDVVHFIATRLGVPYKFFIISEEDYEDIIERYEGLTGQVKEALGELESELRERTPEDKVKTLEEQSAEAEQKEKEQHIVEEAPVTKIVATILRYATDGNASDVHIERMRDNIRVRFRVDGTLNTSLLLPANVHSALVTRVKILASLRLDVKRKPQDGRFSAKIDDRKIDFRVSTLPTYYGEKVVMRILDPEKGVKSLGEIGLSEKNLKLLREGIKAPYGMILISGPTGSGKTTTLYSMLKELDTVKDNVLSLEDPVEYNIEGINQSQVQPSIGYTFANGLRTALRQDPDVIMVGEIRDKETAQLAIHAALTGHLVLSTIHTNNAVGVIPRLIDMGVDPYLIAPTLILAIAQRLVSTLCPGTGKARPVEGSIKMMIDEEFGDLPEEFKKDIQFGAEVYEAESTPECPGGTRGRTAVMEVLKMDKDLEEVILKNASESAIYRKAREKGMMTMKEHAIMKAFNREVPFSDVNSL